MPKQEEVTAVAEIRTSYVDPDTGEKVKVTTEMQTALFAHEEQIVLSTVQMAFSLKAIKDNKLYLMRGCENMKEYIHTFLAKSYSSAKFYMQIADALDGIANKSQLKGLKIGQLGELSKDLLLVEKLRKGDAEISGDKIVHADGTEESLEEHLQFLRATIRNEERANVEKAVNATAKARNDLKQYKHLVEEKNQAMLEKEEEISNLRRMVDELSQAKDIDPRKLRVLNGKKDAAELIRSVNERVIEALGELSGIPHELIDAEIAGYMQTCVASIQTSMKKVKSDFSEVVHIDLSEVG